jgi:hypothetical protein
MVGVAPPGGGVAAGEHAALVADVQGAADVRREQALLAAQVQRLPVGAEDDAGDAAVAGQPAGPGGGDERSEAGAGGTVAGVRVDQVIEVDGDHHVRLHPTQHRQVAGGQGVVGPLHERVGLLLAAAAHVALRAVGLQQRFQHRRDLAPADRVQLEPAGPGAVGMLGHGEPAVLGGVGFSTVGVQIGQVVVHHLRQLLEGPDRGQLGQHPVDRGQVDPGRIRRRPVLLPGDRRHRRHRLGGNPAGGERRGHRRQVLQRPAGAHDLPGGRRGQPAVPAQPRPHRLLPVVLRSLGEVGDAHGARQLGLDPVGRSHQQRRPVQQLRAEHALQVLVGHPARGVLEVGDRITRTVRTHVRRILAQEPSRSLNPQVRGLSTALGNVLTGRRRPVSRPPAPCRARPPRSAAAAAPRPG